MIVPEFWAEARLRERTKGRQLTVRRWGWSNDSQAAAKEHAEERARDAMTRILAGEDLARRELKRAYNGAEGVPIREEVLERVGDVVISRNAYGAHCLNTPNVLFADLDFGEPPGFSVYMAGALVAIALGALHLVEYENAGAAFLVTVAGIVLLPGTFGFVFRRTLGRPKHFRARQEAAADRRVHEFLNTHPDWGLRVYATPAGLRVVATHRLFDPREPSVSELFERLATDPVYRRMCIRQNCFRARLTPKPWRIGIGEHMRPRPGVWPLSPEKLAVRQQWTRRYEEKRQGYSACRFLYSLGQVTIDPEVGRVIRLHDDRCSAFSDRPMG